MAVFFSVIVPVYNVEPYLKKCIGSLLEQKDIEAEWEILLIDDGSTDQSGLICDQISERSSRVKAFHKVNGGLSSARNLGLEKARGKYILFIDSDDLADGRMYHRLYETIQKYDNPDAVCFDGIEHNSDDQTFMKRVPLEQERCTKNGKRYLIEHYKNRNLNVEACLYAYRREFLVEYGLRFREGRLHEDVEFTPRALLACRKIVEIPDPLYHYIVREDSISTQKDRSRNIHDLFLTLKEQCEAADQQEAELRKWMKNAALNSYLNMVYEARMYQPQYRKLMDKRFLFGKAATNWNRFRVLVCFINVRLYCWMNDCYKKARRS